MPYNESLAVASGFGWYSLSGIMLTELANAQLGAMAFYLMYLESDSLVVSIPILVQKIKLLFSNSTSRSHFYGYYTTFNSKSYRSKVAVIAFINGVILSSLVPVLVTFFFIIFN